VLRAASDNDYKRQMHAETVAILCAEKTRSNSVIFFHFNILALCTMG